MSARRAATIVLSAIAAFGSEATGVPPADAIPAYCEVGVGTGGENVAVCRRPDTSALVTPVPAGLYFFITDIEVVPNNASTTGTFGGVVGVDDTTSFPRQPSIDLLGSPRQHLHFKTPYIVLRPGETLAVANYATSAFPIDLRASGYLATTVSEPLPDELFRDGFES